MPSGLESPNSGQTPAVEMSDFPQSLLEGGEAYPVEIVLKEKPRYDVVITAFSDQPDHLTINQSAGSTLFFTPENFAAPQNLMLQAVRDSDTQNTLVKITVESNDAEAQEFDVLITDIDTPNIFLAGTGALSEGQNGELLVTLTTPPAGQGVVTFTANPAGRLTFSPQSLTFNTNSYHLPQTVTVTSVGDADFITEDVTVTATAAGYPKAKHTISIEESKLVPVITGATNITEEGLAEVKIKLAVDPGGTVQLNVASSNESLLAIDTESLTFDSGNYTTDQIVLLSAPADVDLEPASAVLTFSGAVFGTVTRTIAITDNDSQGFTLSGGALVTEGSSADFTVALTQEPSGDYTVGILSFDTSVVVNPTTLTFNADNWQTPQSVTQTANVDADTDNETVDIVVFGNGAPNAQKTLDIYEETGLVITGATAVVESATAEVEVQLDGNPGSTQRTVDVASSNTSLMTVSPSQLTFNSSNYNIPQTITLTAPLDANTIDEQADLQLTGADILNASQTIDIIDFLLEITSVQFLQADNPGLSQDYIGFVDNAGDYFGINLPFQTDVSALVITIVYEGNSIDYTPGTPLDFSTNHSFTISGPAGDRTYNGFVFGWDADIDYDTGVVYMWDGTDVKMSPRCAMGQTTSGMFADCSGTKTLYQFCNANDFSCQNGGTFLLDGSGTSSAYNACSSLNTTPPGGYLGYTNWQMGSLDDYTDFYYASYSFGWSYGEGFEGDYWTDNAENNATQARIHTVYDNGSFFEFTDNFSNKTASAAVRCFVYNP